MVEAVGSDYLGIVADFFHLNIEDGPVTEALRTAGDHLMHIHLADSNRQMPGTGHLDFSDIVRVLDAIDYQGYLSIDCVPAKPDWRTVLTSTREFMGQIEAGVDLQRRLARVA